MDAMYSVGTNNRFAFFIDDEDDPGDVIPLPTKKVEESTKSTKTKGTSKQQGTKGGKGKENKDKASQQANKKPTENGTKPAERPQSNSKGQPRSGGRVDRDRGDQNRRDRGDRDDRPPRGPRGRPRLSSKEKDRDNEGGFGGDQGERGGQRSPRGRGPRPFRGGRGGTGFRGGKREFERRSGNDKSSVKAVDKREGGGAHNWGRQEDSQNDEWPSDEVEQPQEAEQVPNGEAPEEVKTDDDKDEGESSPVEEGPQEMTLDEYRAKTSVVTVKPELQERKAGENVDDTQWKNTFQLEKGEEEFFSGTREVIEKPKTSGRVRTTIDTTGFFFKDQARRGRGRTPGGPGGRGGRRSNEGRRSDFEGGEDRRPGRGDDRRSGRNDDGGGRGGGRRSFGRKRDYAPNVEDEKDFPLLGAQ